MDVFIKLTRNKCVLLINGLNNLHCGNICVCVFAFVCLRGRACVRACVRGCVRDFIQMSGLLVYLPCIVWSLSQIGHPLT